MQKCAAIFLTLAVPLLAGAADSGPQAKPGIRSPISFTGSPPQSSAAQIKLRLNAAEQPGPYDLSQEKFEILVPKDYQASQPHGLFIWISAGDKPSIPAEWDKLLADKKLIFIGAFKSGNPRPVFDRMRLAIDANYHLRQLYRVDPKRVYVSGHSGGARVASMVGVAYADLFTGAACFMGVNYFRDLTAEDGTLFQIRFLPQLEMANLAVANNRYALITGEKDFNRVNTRTIHDEGFVKDGFKAVKLFDIPAQGHNPPNADWLAKVIDFLDNGK